MVTMKVDGMRLNLRIHGLAMRYFWTLGHVASRNRSLEMLIIGSLPVLIRIVSSASSAKICELKYSHPKRRIQET